MSLNLFSTYRRTSEVFPTAPSPNRTILNVCDRFADVVDMSFVIRNNKTVIMRTKPEENQNFCPETTGPSCFFLEGRLWLARIFYFTSHCKSKWLQSVYSLLRVLLKMANPQIHKSANHKKTWKVNFKGGYTKELS